MTIIIGVDPGVSGAIAEMYHDGVCWRVKCHDMPKDAPELNDLVSDIVNREQVSFAVLEKPFYPPGISSQSMGRIGEGYGMLRGVFAAHKVPMYTVRPKEWKKALNVSASKDEARNRAGEFFPFDADFWRLKKHHGRAEAAMIAFYGLKWRK